MLSLLSVALSLLAISTVNVSARQHLSSFHRRGVSASALGGSKVATAWYAGWHAQDFPLTDVSWSKYTQMTYAFAITTPDPTVISLLDSDKALLPQFVSAAHANRVKASLSIGGWTGSRFYSLNVGSAENRTAFVKSVTTLATTYNLDGIDFDWEYPNHQGIGCNVINPDDTANFLSFLQELRQDPVGIKLTLTAATSITPYAGPNGAPSTDVSGFSKVLDHIAIMNYDIWGGWSSSVGPNAPLNDSCALPANQAGSAVSAVKAWTTAGMPANQIVLGVPAYGHSFSVDPSDAYESGSTTTLKAYPSFDAAAQPTGDKWDGAGPDACGVEQGYSGVFTFWGLVAAGFLNADGSVKDGISSRFDECSQTPYVYNATSKVMVSYDNAQSFAAKGGFIKTTGLKGFAMWEAGGDSQDILLNSILNATVYGGPTRGDASTPISSSSSPSSNGFSSFSALGERWSPLLALVPLLLSS